MLENILFGVVVKLSALHLGGRKRVLYKAMLKLVLQVNCLSAFCNIIYNIYVEICSIPENVPRFLKMTFIFLKSDIKGWHLCNAVCIKNFVKPRQILPVYSIN